MSDLNQYAISRCLGSTMKHMKRPSLGPMGLLHAQNQVIAHCPRRGEQITFAPQVDRLIVRAFEEYRKGLPLERVLADPILTAKTLKRAKQLGVAAKDHAVLLRLFRIRKSPVKKIRLANPTVREPKRNHSAYAFAAEMAISLMRYRYGASVDDILAYPNIGFEFDALCQKICPGYSAVDYRLAALYIRKSRYCEENERTLFDSLNENKADHTLTRHKPLDEIEPDRFCGVKGIVGLVEESRSNRFIYLTGTKDVSETVRPFTREETLRAVGNSFWTPSLSAIRVYIFDIQNKLGDANQSLWVKRLIYVKSPIFNQPIRIAGSEAV